MLDPLTALGAVANVAQFIEFAIKIFSSSRDIYHSASGSLVEHNDLSKVTGDISNLSGKLRDSLNIAAVTVDLTADEQALFELCKACVAVSEHLMKALDKIRGQGKPGKFRSFRQALKSVWSKDDIDQLEKRVRMYKEELNVRIIVGLRATIDTQALRQSEGFATLGDDIKAVVTSMDSIRTEIQDGLQRHNEALVVLHAHTETLIGAHAEQDRDEHKILGSQINALSQQSSDQSNQILDAQAIAKLAVDLAVEQNLAEHNRTREEMNRLKEQAERQVEVLTEEIRLLKIELENSVKAIVASINTASKKEAERMKEVSNAKFNMWVAKELILEKLKAFIALFRFNFATEVWTSNTLDFKSWKLTPYPKADRTVAADAINRPGGFANIEERSTMLSRIDIHYPIAAGNVPLLKLCLEQGADANQTPQGHSTPLMKAIEASYNPLISRNHSMMEIARRDSRKMVQLLLDNGADPELMAFGCDARELEEHLSKKRQFGGRAITVEPDWMIKELLSPDPDPSLQQCLAITDAAWAGESETMAAILAERPGLCQLMQVHRSSPLGVAVYRGDANMVNMLLDHGFSPDALDFAGSTPLGNAVKAESVTMIQLLVWRGANLSTFDPVLRLTPLDHTAWEGKTLLCSAFLETLKTQGPLAQVTLSRLLALSVASLYSLDVLVLLLDNGADISLDMRDFITFPKGESLEVEHLSPLDYVEKCMTPKTNKNALAVTMKAILADYEEKAGLRAARSSAAPPTGFADMIEIEAAIDNSSDDG